jgi:quercetin dioxygenase-like cupin family protein
MKKTTWSVLAAVAAAAAFGRLSSAADAPKKAEEPKKTEAGAQPAAKKPAKEIVRPADQVKFDMVPGMDSVSKVVLWGNPKKAHGGLTKFKAGTKVPMHTHSQRVEMVIVSGTIVHGTPDGKTVNLGPGSYMMIPADSVHSTACADGADCEFYEAQPGEFDLKMVEGKPGEKPAEKK